MSSHPVFDMPLLRGPVPLSHMLISNFVFEGDKAVDATCGNGNDTIALAKLTGLSGQTWGFDIQDQAITETRRRLSRAGLAERVILLQTGHEEMELHVNAPVKAILFNLGYLPGGDHSVITRPETTRSALGQSTNLLLPGGIVIVTIYPGHDGGTSEQQTVNEWAVNLNHRDYHSWHMGQMNVTPEAPYCIIVQKTT